MSNEKLYIPKKIKVGQVERDGTYTNRLGYVIYQDDKDKWRKEVSWESWRDKKIDPVEHENSPTEGFVLNKKAGGYSTGWNHRNTYCRVYDPRGFEFEISIENLLFILTNSVSSPGKALEGEFVYSWSGKELVLLPVVSSEYKESSRFTKLQNKKFSLRDLVVGHTYVGKDVKDHIYLGRMLYTAFSGYENSTTSKMQHVFYNESLGFHPISAGSKIAHSSNDDVHKDLNELLYKFEKSAYASFPVGLIKERVFIYVESDLEREYGWRNSFVPKDRSVLIENPNNGQVLRFSLDDREDLFCISPGYEWGVNNKNLVQSYRRNLFSDKYDYRDKFRYTEDDVENMVYYKVSVRRENGTTIPISEYF